MEIEIFNDSGNGEYIKIFYVIVEGKPVSVKVGNQVVPVEKGIQFFVYPYVGYQIDKCELYMYGLEPKLRVIEGEELVVPDKAEKEKRIEQLKKELEKLEDAE